MSPIVSTNRTVRKSDHDVNTANDLTPDQLLNLIPLWQDIGEVLGRVRRTEEKPKFKRTGVASAVYALHKIQMNSSKKTSVEAASDVIEYFDKFIYGFSEALKMKAKIYVPNENYSPKDKIAMAKITKNQKLWIEWLRQVLSLRRVGGHWDDKLEYKLLNHFGSDESKESYGRGLANLVRPLFPMRYRGFLGQKAYDSRSASRKNRLKYKGDEKNFLIKIDFTTVHDLLNAIDADKDFLESYISQMK